MIQVDDEQEHQERPGDAIADLRAAGKRLADADLSAAIRRVLWQAARDAQRAAAAETQATRSSAQVEVLTSQRDLIGRQRDEAIAQVRQLQRSGPDARLERLSVEIKRAIQQAKDALAERDETRMAWERARTENDALRAENTALRSKPAPVAAAISVKTPKPKVSEAVAAIPAIEPSVEEAALFDQRAAIVAEVDRLTAIGKLKRTPAQQTRLLALQAQLADFAPKVKAFKMARHAKRMQLEAEVMAAEAMKAAGLA